MECSVVRSPGQAIVESGVVGEPFISLQQSIPELPKPGSGSFPEIKPIMGRTAPGQEEGAVGACQQYRIGTCSESDGRCPGCAIIWTDRAPVLVGRVVSAHDDMQESIRRHCDRGPGVFVNPFHQDHAGEPFFGRMVQGTHPCEITSLEGILPDDVGFSLKGDDFIPGSLGRSFPAYPREQGMPLTVCRLKRILHIEGLDCRKNLGVVFSIQVGFQGMQG